MVYYKLLKTENNIATYEYTPEHGQYTGVVSVNTVTFEGDIVKLAKNDEFKRYAFHAIWGIAERFEKDDMTQNGYIAWG